MADAEPRKRPADSLEDSLALVLKETGKFFRASQSLDQRNVGIAKLAIAQNIPAANNKFHDALDDIEIAIVRAKSVFERDLSSIRAKRAARERAAAGILRTKSPNGVVKNSAPNGSSKTQTATSNGDHLKPSEEDINGTAVTDVPMTEEPADKSPSPKPEPSNDAVKTEPFTLPPSLPQDPSQPKGLAISVPPDPLAAKPTAPTTRLDPELNVTTTSKPPSTAPSSQAPLSATFPDAQFESMFNDTDLPTSTADDLDFSLDFASNGVDADGSADLLDASAFANISLPNTNNDSNAQLQNSNTTANEDLTALLPGLENYVNASNDFSAFTNIGSDLFNADATNTNTTTLNLPASLNGAAGGDNGAPQQQQAPPPSAPQQPQAPIESSFEDMFGLDSYMNGTGDDELGGAGGMGEVGDFDEDWFKGEGI